MRNLLLTIGVLMVCISTYGQISGTKSIPGDYATIGAAIAALNSQGVTAPGVTFNVAANHTETFATVTAGLITTTTSSATAPIVFQKSGAGSNPVITAGTPGTGTLDNVICILGTDYITFDGINILENAANTTATTQMEWGYAVLKASATNGSQYVTIKNCAISLSALNTASYGIYSNNITNTSTTQLTVTATSGANSNNKFYSNTFSGVYNGIYCYGFADVAPYAYYDQNNEIGKDGGNSFTTLGGGTSTSYAIYALYQNNFKIAYNTFTGTHANTTGAVYGIYMSTMNNANLDVYNNTISWTYNGTGTFYGMYSLAGGSGISNVTNIYNNNVTGVNLPNATSGTFYGIYTYGGMTATWHHNTVSNINYGSGVSAATGTIYGLYTYTSPTTAGTAALYNNTVSNISRNQSALSTGTGYYFYQSGGNGTMNIYDNLVDNLAINSTSTQYVGYCLYSGAKNFYNNTISNIYNANATVYAFYNGNGTTGQFFRNRIFNITANSATGIIYGIYQGSGTSMYYYNNYISELKTPAATGAISIAGAYLTGGTTNGFYNNTIYLNASSTGGGVFGTAGIYASTTPVVDLRNNIVVNTSTPGATGYTVALRYSGTSLTNFASTSNNNDYFAGTPGTNNLIFYDGTNADQTLAAFKVRVAPRESSSVTENPPFVNIAAPPYNLHIQTTIPTQLESAAVVISTPVVITTDYDNDPRYPNAGYPNNPTSPAVAPDMGADEFAGLLLDATPPLITLTPLVNTSTTGNRLLVTNITDATGVPTAGIGLPKLYWKINSGSWNNVTATYVSGSQYNFTFGAGAVTGDVVSYYVVAQDLVSPTPNIVASPSAGASGYSFNPPACSVLPTTPYSYVISLGGLSGTYTVGVTMFNSVTGKNITFEKVINRVMKEVDVEVPNTNPPTVDATETAAKPNSVKQWMEVEEISWIPMENGNPYTGDLFATIPPSPDGDGPLSPSGIYATITAAFADLNTRGVIGPVTFVLTDATYPTETFPLTMNIFNTTKPTATNTITIKPNTGVVASITGAAASTQMFKILESYVTIDGSNSGGTDRSLTIENTATTSPQVIVVGSLGTTPITNVTLKNCTFINGTNGSSAVIISDGTTPATAGYFSNITFQNNSVQKAYIAVYSIAVMAAGNGNGVLFTGNSLNTSGANMVRLAGLYLQGLEGATVTNNTIGNMDNTTDASNITGIWLATGAKNAVVSGNTISTMSGTSAGPRGIACSAAITGANITLTGNTISGISTASSVVPYGIYIFSTTTQVSVKNNQINGLLNTNTGGYGARGINLATTVNPANIDLINNVVYDIVATSDASTTYWAIGISIDGSAGVNVYHNSVYLYGSYAGYSSSTISTAFYVASTSSALNVRDNIFVNSYDNTGSTTDKSYAINSQAANTAFTNINYNNYFVSGATGVLGYLGADQLTLANWQTATGKDANSQNLDPAFVSSTDLHPTNVALDNLGFYFATIPADFAGIMRTNPPDIGAFEFGTNPALTTGSASGVTCEGATLNGSINANGLTVNSYFDYGLTTAYGSSVAGVPAVVTGTTPTAVMANLTGLVASSTYHYRIRGVAGGVESYGSNMMFTTNASGAPTVTTETATGIGATTATLNGTVNANCNSTTVTFEYGLNTSYGTSVAATPGTVNGGTFTPVLVNLTGLSTGTTYHYRTVASNTAGTTYGSDMTVTTGAVPPTVTTNAATSIGNFAAQLNGTVNANNLTTTVTFEWGTTTSYGNVVNGVPNTLTGMTPTAVLANLTGLNSNTTYHFRCVGQNSAGTTYGANQMFTTLCPIPMAAGVITGPASLCQGTSGHIYTVPAITYATGYTWTLPTGGTITAGAGTNSITVSYSTSAVSGNVSVYGTSVCGNGASSSLAVTVNPLPVPTISGASPACINSTYTYSTQTGMTGYTWTVSSGGTITSGAGTNAVVVRWNNTGAQYVTVTYTSASGCPAAAPTMKNVTVSSLPNPTITGLAVVCVSTGYDVYTTEAGFSSYVWTVSSGGTIVSGQGTYQIEVSWATTGNKTVTVNYNNASGCSAAAPASFSVTVTTVPADPGTMTGTDELCAGTTGVAYSVAPVSGATNYAWSVPTGATIVSGGNTNSIIVDFALNASSGEVSVQGTNGCGAGSASTMDVTVNPIPPTPVITVDDENLLTSSTPDGNQWYFEGVLISGATGQTYQAENNGDYYTIVTLNGCSSEPSNTITVLTIGIGEPAGQSFSIYPVPNKGIFKVSISTIEVSTFTVSVINTLGETIYTMPDLEVNSQTERTIDLGSVAKGIYTVKFESSKGVVVRKIMITN